MSCENLNGHEFQNRVANILRENHGVAKTEKYIGTKDNGIRYRADVVLIDKMIIVECKIKNTKGTIEEKILDKAMHMQHMIDTTSHKRGVIVYGGIKWNLIQMRYLETKIPKLFPSVSMIRYEDDTELKNI